MDKEFKVTDAAFKIADLAVQAILYESACFPSPGLVSPISDGAHKDMDYYMFLDSTASLIKPLLLCAQAGYTKSEPRDIFKSIREIGLSGEKEMFLRTYGVNTHKGMLFLMGITAAAVAKAIYEKKDFNFIREVIVEMTNGISQSELMALPKDKKDLSHGERLYLEFGVKGIRGEVEEGLPIVFEQALSIYDKCSDIYINDRLLHTLIGIMQYCEDTTILHRHNLETLKEVQAKAKFITGLGGMKTDFGVSAVYELDREFKKRGISPGGSADLLAVTVFLSSVKENIKF
jgi:triphosphoribosyl-dephospho-CoA synthase